MPQKEDTTQFAIKTTRISEGVLPEIDYSDIDHQFSISKGNVSIVYVSTKKLVSRHFFGTNRKGRKQIESAGFKIETVKTGDQARTLIKKEWEPTEWTCTDRDALEQLIGEIEEEDEEAQIDWDSAIKGGKVDTKKVNPLSVERDFNSRLESGEVEDLDSYTDYVRCKSHHFNVELNRSEHAL